VVSSSKESDFIPTADFINKYDITKREQEIICLVLNGKSNEEIAEILFISPSTVFYQVKLILNHIKRV
jgi:DNA-binding CsgD family transcriptional regulator